MVALSPNDARVEELVLRPNAVMAKEASNISELGGNASDDEVAVTLQETEGDLRPEGITQRIESMNDEKQDALVALFWIGRDDWEPDEWGVTKALARQQHEGSTSRCLLGQPEVGEYLTEGLKKMLECGVD